MDESSVTQNRTFPAIAGAARRDCRNRRRASRRKAANLSEQGALIEGDRMPEEGAETHFQRNELRLKSRIVWVHGKYAGVPSRHR